jgi:hypothetical protein
MSSNGVVLPEPLAALQGVPYKAVGGVTQDEFATIVKLLDLHMARERLEDIDGILQSLTTEPVFVIEYLPVNISNRWWWSRKIWPGRDAVIAFYQGLFETFRGFEVSILRYTVSPRGVVDLSRITGRVLPIGSGVPVSVTVSAFLPFDPVARRLTGERVYLSEDNALKNL